MYGIRNSNNYPWLARSHMKQIGIDESALCHCGQEAKNTAHVLQSCPVHKEERETTWPTESSIGNKLHGTATDLRLTLRFIALTGLHIWQVQIERWRRRPVVLRKNIFFEQTTHWDMFLYIQQLNRSERKSLRIRNQPRQFRYRVNHV